MVDYSHLSGESRALRSKSYRQSQRYLGRNKNKSANKTVSFTFKIYFIFLFFEHRFKIVKSRC